MFGFPLGSFPRPFLCRPCGLPLSVLPLASLPSAALAPRGLALLCPSSGLLVGLFAVSVAHILHRGHHAPPFRHSLPLFISIDRAFAALATGPWLERVWLSRMPNRLGIALVPHPILVVATRFGHLAHSAYRHARKYNMYITLHHTTRLHYASLHSTTLH